MSWDPIKGALNMAKYEIIREVKNFYKIITLNVLRETHGVIFDVVPVEVFTKISAMDRVLHKPGAVSPGGVGPVKRPWYVHPHQEDNLIVFAGSRTIDLYCKEHGIVTFTITPYSLEINNQRFRDEPVMLCWSTRIFHRIISHQQLGSASLNIAVRNPGFDILTNFNIYDLNTETGEYQVIREGSLDQPEEKTPGKHNTK